MILCSMVLLPARAQIPVTVTSDFQALQNQVESMAKWAEQLKSMRDQFNKLSQQYDAVTGHYGRGAFGLTDAASAASVVPGSWQDVVARQKNGAFDTMQQNVENQIKTLPRELFQYPHSLEASGYTLSTDAVRAAMAGGQALYAQVQTNLNNLTAMATQIDQTINTKDAADLQSRIAAENGLLQSALAKLSVMNLNLQANMLNQQNQAVAQNQQRYGQRDGQGAP
jgi:type IV secretion system protein VirB5